MPPDDFSDFEDFLSTMEPGHKAKSWGILRYREGNDPRNWASPGQSIYVPVDYQILIGCIKWTGAAATSGAVEITFPAAFVQNPIMLVTPSTTTPLFQDVRCQVTIASAESAEVYWFSAVNLTLVTFFWFALGPVGV